MDTCCLSLLQRALVSGRGWLTLSYHGAAEPSHPSHSEVLHQSLTSRPLLKKMTDRLTNKSRLTVTQWCWPFSLSKKRWCNIVIYLSHICGRKKIIENSCFRDLQIRLNCNCRVNLQLIPGFWCAQALNTPLMGGQLLLREEAHTGVRDAHSDNLAALKKSI